MSAKALLLVLAVSGCSAPPGAVIAQEWQGSWSQDYAAVDYQGSCLGLASLPEGALTITEDEATIDYGSAAIVVRLAVTFEGKRTLATPADQPVITGAASWEALEFTISQENSDAPLIVDAVYAGAGSSCSVQAAYWRAP